MIEATDIRKTERAGSSENNGYSLHSLVLQPFYDEGGITIYCGDNRKILAQLDDCDLLLTDPPYGLNVLKTGKVGYTGAKDWGKSDWDAATPDRWMMELCRAKSRWQIIWGGNYYELPPRRGWLVWDKENGDNGYADAELAWTNLEMAVRRIKYRWAGMLQANMAEKDVRWHPTQKATAVMEWALGFVPECKTLLDPWAGSGTTLIAARAKGMQADGIEINEKYCEAAKQRLSQGVLLAV